MKRMVRKPAAVLVAVLFFMLLAVLPALAQGDLSDAYTEISAEAGWFFTAAETTVYTEPSASSAPMRTLSAGELVWIVSSGTSADGNTWRKIGTFEGLNDDLTGGYLDAGSVSPIVPGGYRISPNLSVKLLARSGPAKTYDRVGSFSAGTKLDVLEISESGFGRVSQGGVTGWVFLGYTRYTGEEPVGGFVLSFDAAGGTGAPLAMRITASSPVSLPLKTPVRDGYAFCGWAEAPGQTEVVYRTGSSYQGSSDATLYAVWIPATTADGIRQKLDSLRSVYPDRWFWNHLVSSSSDRAGSLLASSRKQGERFSDSVSQTPCATHSGSCAVGKYDCNVFDNAMQCFGFARKLFYEIYGERVYGAAKHTDVANVAVGDFISVRNNSHYAIVLSRTDTSVTVVSCNFSGLGAAYRCQIRWDTPTYEISELTYYVRATNYAVADGTSYSVVYDANGGENAPAPRWKAAGAALTVTSAEPFREGYEFLGWATEKDSSVVAYRAGDSIRENCDRTLYAVWGHDHRYEEAVTLPTCTAGGFTAHICSVCGDTYRDTFTEATGHAFGDWIVRQEPTTEAEGVRSHVCGDCGQEETEPLPKLPALAFRSASLALHSDLTVVFSLDRSLLEAGGYTGAYVVFSWDGEEETVVTAYTETETALLFRFENIAPFRMGDTFTATPYAVRDGKTVAGKAQPYGIGSYCMRKLSQSTTDAKTRTLLVDLLRYGAATQQYTGYRTDALADAFLTEEQAAWGTEEIPVMVSVTDPAYIPLEGAEIVWKSASLVLKNRISVRTVFAAEKTDGLSVRVTDREGNLLEEITDFEEAGAGRYAVSFDGYSSAKLSAYLLFTVCRDGKPVSHTLAYSAESYCSGKQNAADETLAALVIALMRYGNASVAYAT